MINIALTHYCAVVGQPYIPQAYSASGFRKKFRQIQGCQRQSAKPLPITTTAHAIRDELDLVWPGDEKKHELQCIQTTLTNYQQFLDDLYSLADRHPDDSAIQYLNRAVQADASIYCGEWVTRVQSMAYRWEHWNGDLLAWAWHRGHRWFALEMKRLLIDWDNDENSWKKILEKLETNR